MKDYKSRIKIKAEAEDVYAAIVNPFTLELWTGAKAEMSEVPGSEFSLWDGDISGMNLEFEPYKRIVQQWYFGAQEIPSIVTFKLFPSKGTVQLDLLHTNIPEEDYDDMVHGWEEFYLEPLKQFLEIE